MKLKTKGIFPLPYKFPFKIQREQKGRLYVSNRWIFTLNGELKYYYYDYNNWIYTDITNGLNIKPTDDIEIIKDIIYEDYKKRYIST